MYSNLTNLFWLSGIVFKLRRDIETVMKCKINESLPWPGVLIGIRAANDADARLIHALNTDIEVRAHRCVDGFTAG